MKNLFFIVSIALFTLACKKDPIEFTVKGTVSDSTFGGGLEGASLTITQIPIGGGTNKVVGTATLGADGKYAFTFPREKVEKYLVSITKNNYFALEEKINFSEFSPEEDLVKNYATPAKAWVRLRFVNQSPQETDAIKITRQQGKTGCAECCSPAAFFLYGMVDTTMYCINDGNATYSYMYQDFASGQIAIKSVITVPFDTVTLSHSY